MTQVNELESEMQNLSDDDLRLKTDQFKSEYLNDSSLDDLLPKAFAVVREASVRTIGLRHF